MPTACWVTGCPNYAITGSNVRFFSFPVMWTRTPELKALSLERRKLWFAAINRKNLNTKYARVCSKHFVSGKSAKLQDRYDPDWVPSLHLGYERQNESQEINIDQDSSSSSSRCSNEDDPFQHAEDFEKPIFDHIEESSMPKAQDPLCDPFSNVVSNKCIQVDLNPFQSYTALWDTDKKLYTMTGLPDFSTLNYLVNACQKITADDNIKKTMRDRILLTMHKLKSNCDFAQLAISFQISDKLAELYFTGAIKLLANTAQGMVNWQTKEQNNMSYPVCFNNFPNVRTVLECIQLKTGTIRNDSHIFFVFIGLSPLGFINYVSKVAIEESSNTVIINLTDLIGKLKAGDAVMVDRGFMFGEEFREAGIEIIQPALKSNIVTETDVGENTIMAAARVHVDKRIEKLKSFKVFSENIELSTVPYIDDIMTVLCGISNSNLPCSSDDKIKKKSVNNNKVKPN